MNKRQRKKAQTLGWRKVHELLDLTLIANGGLRERKQKVTGNHPTAFFSYYGHTNEVDITINPNGWSPQDDPECVRYVVYFSNVQKDEKHIDNICKAMRKEIKNV